MGLLALPSNVVPLIALGLLAAACATRGSLVPPDQVEDSGGVIPDDLGPDAARRDVPDPLDDVPLVDRPDAPMRPACPAYVPPTRTEPCAGRPDCALPTRGRVDVLGATGPLQGYQVRVELPAAVRAAVGPACDRLVFRTMSNEWAPHWVANCATGVVWVRVPTIAAGTTVLTMHYGGANAVPAAQSYDDTFDRVPLQAANLLGAYTFDEGVGSRTCPSGGLLAPPFDAFIHQTPYDLPQKDVAEKPPLWSTAAPLSLLNPANMSGRFTRNQRSLNFPRHPVLPAAGVPSPNRLVNWQSPDGRPFNSARAQLTVGVWVNPTTPSNAFNDNFQTVVCFGMPTQTERAAFWRLPKSDPRIVNNAIFNPWAIFFRGDGEDDTLYQGNSCVEPCTDVMQYAHITTVEPLAGAAFARHWHFLAFTIDTTARPHTIRRSYYDGNTYQYPRELDLFPPGGLYCPANPNPAGNQPDPLVAPCYPAAGAASTCWQPCSYLCPGTVDGMIARNTCVYPPEAPIQYPPAPVVIGADMNDGEAQLGLEGTIDDLFLLNRAASAEEMQAYRERRQYSPMPITVVVTP